LGLLWRTDTKKQGQSGGGGPVPPRGRPVSQHGRAPTAAVAAGRLYTGGSAFYVVGVKTGKPAWSRRFRVGLPIKSSPVVSGNMLFVKDYDGNLYAFVGRAASPA